MKFDREKWKADRGKRFRMAENIIDEKLLLGMDSNDVKILLGDTAAKYADSATIQRWIFDMGEGGGGLGFKFHSLAVRFRNDKVESVHHLEIRD